MKPLERLGVSVPLMFTKAKLTPLVILCVLVLLVAKKSSLRLNGRTYYHYLHIIVPSIPLHKLMYSFLYAGFGLVAKIGHQAADVGVGAFHIAGLHGE